MKCNETCGTRIGLLAGGKRHGQPLLDIRRAFRDGCALDLRGYGHRRNDGKKSDDDSAYPLIRWRK
jgi:hypothetical protein